LTPTNPMDYYHHIESKRPLVLPLKALGSNGMKSHAMHTLYQT